MNNKKSLLGRDELNLVEVPFTVLSTRIKGLTKLNFIDKQDKIIRHWTIKGSEEFGLPCAADEEVYIAMVYLTQQNGFKDRQVYFNQYELLNFMEWRKDGPQYKRLELALCRLVELIIYTDYLWDKGSFKEHFSKTGFHLLEEFFLDKGTKSNKNSYFIWSDKLFNSFLTGNIKTLDIETYFNLQTATSKRFYRLWDKRLYKNDQITFDLLELCHEKLGVSRKMKTPSELKRVLNPALEEQKQKNLLSLAEYRKKKNKRWVLTIKKCDKEITKPIENNRSEETPLFSKLLALKIPRNRTEKLIKEYNDNNVIEDWIKALEVLNPRNKAGFLITALAEAWELPKQIRQKKSVRDRETEDSLKARYYEAIFKQVDSYIKEHMIEAELEAALKQHRQIFLVKYPSYKQFRDSILLDPLVENDFKEMKAQELGLASFEEWVKGKNLSS